MVVNDSPSNSQNNYRALFRYMLKCVYHQLLNVTTNCPNTGSTEQLFRSQNSFDLLWYLAQLEILKKISRVVSKFLS